MMCCLGCMTLVPGVREKLVQGLAFFPPRPPGYRLDNGEFMYVKECGDVSPLPPGVTHVPVSTAGGGVLCCLHFRCKDPRPGRQVLVYAHGNSM